MLETLPSQQLSLIRPYAQWSVLRRARRRAIRRRYTDHSAASDRNKIRIAIRLHPVATARSMSRRQGSVRQLSEYATMPIASASINPGDPQRAGARVVGVGRF
ncbi:hypothetical protein SIM91_18865 [Rhodococcus opacus]|uniref:hypothetical protein n=2 Tax=Rhodococcus opacus TaxID=37919 RepID=UPI0002FEC55E|nr:hypothetical protein [Rhodococcus opacus]MDX5965319.1 hypothetical protein [Rhodococcus opacus]NKY76783.1 hypothetical protein [Rhodococcus opacus]